MDQDHEDPLNQFFPDENNVDLYAILGVSSDACQEEIRKAYRRQALLYHPDKQTQASRDMRVNTSLKFQQIGFAYAVLSDETRRRRYDSTGSTAEGLTFEDGADGWDAYFKDLFDKVTIARLDEDKKVYQDSFEELQDLQAAYLASEGAIDGIFERIPHSNYTDEDRFIKILNDSIKRKEIPSLPLWKKQVADKQGKARRKKDGEKEAREAEEAAKELGVYDAFYQSKTNLSTKGEEAGEDYAVLKALIQGKKRRAEDFLDGLAAKYSDKTRVGGRQKRSKGK